MLLRCQKATWVAQSAEELSKAEQRALSSLTHYCVGGCQWLIGPATLCEGFRHSELAEPSESSFKLISCGWERERERARRAVLCCDAACQSLRYAPTRLDCMAFRTHPTKYFKRFPCIDSQIACSFKVAGACLICSVFVVVSCFFLFLEISNCRASAFQRMITHLICIT